ncbi:hypothetical protein QA644_08535 [Rhizobium sp. CC1099]|uniref:hypothetical protein n=1 Tax=Rhizobium sp. CC1099 TaxID=3039160 RepID=UPI0024B18D58|nr:hypothetical protein [Rhizobium sp. CC1099]WFU89074.1 hypothetical protein QA644_08535 [Rhizobium sp. CC1099]
MSGSTLGVVAGAFTGPAMIPIKKYEEQLGSRSQKLSAKHSKLIAGERPVVNSFSVADLLLAKMIPQPLSPITHSAADRRRLSKPKPTGAPSMFEVAEVTPISYAGSPLAML